MTDNEIVKLEKLFDDKDLMLFYLTWIKNGLNAGKAYRELHPDVTEHSARTLGSKLLTKIDKTVIMQAYGLDHQAYFQQLKDGLDATKRDQFSGEISPDHRVRKDYHDKLGKLLGVETDQPASVDVKILVIPGELLKKYDISSNAK